MHNQQLFYTYLPARGFYGYTSVIREDGCLLPQERFYSARETTARLFFVVYCSVVCIRCLYGASRVKGFRTGSESAGGNDLTSGNMPLREYQTTLCIPAERQERVYSLSCQKIYPPPPPATIHYMVPSIRVFYSQWSCHTILITLRHRKSQAKT